MVCSSEPVERVNIKGDAEPVTAAEHGLRWLLIQMRGSLCLAIPGGVGILYTASPDSSRKAAARA
jgi:hypothetical protein